MTRSSEPDPDAELLARLHAGDPRAAQAIVDAKLPRIFGLAQRLLGDPAEAEDVAQESFIRLWRQAPRWRPGGARLDTWLHRVALNLCYDRMRIRRRQSNEPPPEIEDPSPSAEQGLTDEQTARRVAQAVAALPERQRQAVVLCHYQDLGNIEAARTMGVSIEALEGLLGRGRRALRLALAGRD